MAPTRPSLATERGYRRAASEILWRGLILKSWSHSSHRIPGPSATPVLARRTRGGTHEQIMLIGPRPSLRAVSSASGSHAVMALLRAFISGAKRFNAAGVSSAGTDDGAQPTPSR